MKIPILLLTGTPGTGKSTMASRLAEDPGCLHLNLSTMIKESPEAWGGVWSEKWKSYLVKSTKKFDKKLKKLVKKKNDCSFVILDYHSPDMLPNDLVDFVVVLRTKTNILYGRLEARGYSERKITENIDAEIFNVVMDQAEELCDEILELNNDVDEDLEKNLEIIRNHTQCNKI